MCLSCWDSYSRFVLVALQPWSTVMRILVLGILALISTGSALTQSPSPYRVIRTHALGGEGSWDYLIPDPPTHRLFVGRQNRVMVVDENTGALLGEVPGIKGAHGVAIAPDAGRGFATAGDDAAIVVFDLKSYATLGRIPAAEDADAIIYDKPSNRVFSFNGDAHSSTVVDASATKLVTNIPLGGKPEYGVSLGDGRVFVNLTDTGEIVEIDAQKATAGRRWSTAPCRNPVAMAVDAQRSRLFSGCRSGVLAISDVTTAKVVATAPIGMGVDGVAYDPSTADVFASNADGTLTVIHQEAADQYRVVQTLTTPVGSRNLGLDTTLHRLFVAAAQFGPTPAGGRGRGPMVTGSFVLLEIGR
jgi:DNA-binding beta-propeller fold protein YncE